ncbi:17.5 kDa class I heat shock protein-like [Diospyros lotus]|uniref:17.5 kDa class I heat shock protein-like n=1 Tax=Diospyros lotus TaxID=55363 RepID=UPI00224CE607|nr:17.5 kDa class I heat shock protein-like [Diospyros lotus]
MATVLCPSVCGGRRSNISSAFHVRLPMKEFASSCCSAEFSKMVNPPCVDWRETPEAHQFMVDLPGVNYKEEVKVEVELKEDRVLKISGEWKAQKPEEEEEEVTWHRRERSSGKFVRRFRLPENVKTEEVKASMENGVLTVSIPKEEVKKDDVKNVEIDG